MWLSTVTGNYHLKAAYSGNENVLGTITIIDFVIEPCTDQSVFLINSNSTITNLSFNSANKELSFTVSGDNGTRGYAYVCVPKSTMNNADGLKIVL